MRFDDVERQREAEARSGDVRRLFRVDAVKALENTRLLVPGDADAVIDDVDERLLVPRADANLDAFRIARVLHGVAEQIQNRLCQRLRVRAQFWFAAITRDGQGEAQF